ncbi:HAD-IA family hydrolase [Candidatus Sumerlaeota bacterium]|nr:HAD-IA family hydrolase [Candidatus Sumerlaeota bacterium]
MATGENGGIPSDLIIWDLDGTLADTLEDITDALNRTLTARGLPQRTPAEVMPSIGRGIFNLIAREMGGAPDDPDVVRAVAEFREDYSANLLVKTQLYPGILEVLDHFASRKQAVISNKIQSMTDSIIEGLGIRDRFIEVIGAENDYPFKPDPASTLAVIQAAGVEPGRTVFIGDSDCDFHAARNAGCHVVLVTWGLRPPEEVRSFEADAHIDSARELIDILR